MEKSLAARALHWQATTGGHVFDSSSFSLASDLLQMKTARDCIRLIAYLRELVLRAREA